MSCSQFFPITYIEAVYLRIIYPDASLENGTGFRFFIYYNFIFLLKFKVIGGKNMKLYVKKSAMYPMGERIYNLLSSSLGNSPLPSKVIMARNSSSGKIEFFIDETLPSNGIGFLSKNQADGVLDAVDSILSKSLDYSVSLAGIDSGLIVCDLDYESLVSNVSTVDNDIFKTEIERIISLGICTEDLINQKIDYMHQHRFPDGLILKVLQYHDHVISNVCNPKTLYIDPEPKSSGSSILGRCVLNALNGSAMIYEGDKSVGKNVCAETVAWLLNQPYYVITFNKRMTNDDVYGTKSTDNSALLGLNKELALSYLKLQQYGIDNCPGAIVDEAAEYELLRAKASSVSIIQDPSVFVECVRNGGVLCLNEMNMAEANFLSGLVNPLTDGSRFLDIPGVGRLPIHPKCIVIGTQNAEYTGVCEQNDATMSRFGCIQFDYPKSIRSQLEAVVGKDRLNKKYFIDTDKYYGNILKAVQKGVVTNSCLNIRGFIRALNATADVPGFTTLSENIITHVINTCPFDDRMQLIAQLNEIVTI